MWLSLTSSTHRRLPCKAFRRWSPNFCLGNTAQNRHTARARDLCWNRFCFALVVCHHAQLPVIYLLYLSDFFFFSKCFTFNCRHSSYIFFFKEVIKVAIDLSFHEVCVYGAGHALTFEVTSWTKNKVLHSLPYESPAQRLMTNVTDKCLVSKKEPSGDNKYMQLQFYLWFYF